MIKTVFIKLILVAGETLISNPLNQMMKLHIVSVRIKKSVASIDFKATEY